MVRRWLYPSLFALAGVAIAGRQAATGSPVTAVVFAFVFAGLAVAVSPLAFPRSISAADARQRSAADGRPVVYWRPGCPYCLRLRVRLVRHARRMYWVDIWRDPAAAAAVREITGGDETVPTVVLAGQPHVNPDPAWLLARLTGRS